MRRLFIIIMLLTLPACMVSGRGGNHHEPPVYKGAPVVYIHPLSKSYQRAAVGVLPFEVPRNMDREQGMSVAALFKDVMLGKRIFKTVRQLDDPYSSDLQTAVEAGRRAGVDFVMVGKIKYALEGTELGGARVNVSVRLINTRSGNTVWYVEQGMDQPMDYPDAGFVARFLGAFSKPPVRKPSSAPVVPNMLARIAVDMADVFDGAQTVSR